MQPQIQSDKQIIEPPSRLRDAAQRTHPRRRWLISVLSVLIVATLLIYGIWTRVRAKAALADETNQTAVIAVSVVQPQRTAPTQEITLPGSAQFAGAAPQIGRAHV